MASSPVVVTVEKVKEHLNLLAQKKIITERSFHREDKSCTSVDSGFTSRDLSRSPSFNSESLIAGSHGNSDTISTPLHSINENGNPDMNGQNGNKAHSPVKIVMSVMSSEDKITKKPTRSDAATSEVGDPFYLNVPKQQRGRKDSTSSSTSTSSQVSDEFHTAPSSPIAHTYMLTRRLSAESLSSSSSTQELSLQMEIDIIDGKIKVETKARIKKCHALELALSCSQKVPRKRSISSPASSPNSPSSFNRKISPHIVHQAKGNRKDFEQQQIKNECIKTIVQNNLVNFTNLTSLTSLYPHLIQTRLISDSDYNELEAYGNSKSKMNFFYIFLLNNKGSEAYLKLYECLQKEEEHLGHRDLARIIQRNL